MTKEKAIQILTRQRDKLDDPKVPNDDAWIFQTADCTNPLKLGQFFNFS